MDVNIYSSLIEGIVAVLLVLWLAHACTFLPLAFPFFLQVRTFSTIPSTEAVVNE